MSAPWYIILYQIITYPPVLIFLVLLAITMYKKSKTLNLVTLIYICIGFPILHAVITSRSRRKTEDILKSALTKMENNGRYY